MYKTIVGIALRVYIGPIGFIFRQINYIFATNKSILKYLTIFQWNKCMLYASCVCVCVCALAINIHHSYVIRRYVYLYSIHTYITIFPSGPANDRNRKFPTFIYNVKVHIIFILDYEFIACFAGFGKIQ